MTTTDAMPDRRNATNGHYPAHDQAVDAGVLTTKGVLAWLPAVLAFATFVSTVAVGLSQLKALQAQHDEVAKRLEAHSVAAGHTESLVREQALEASQAEFRKVLEEHDRADKARDARMDRMDVNVLLVCQATRGAGCVKP